ncbi:hypothetical protein AVEN_131394-1 [Araneus ventricosus]|uniref:Uncharacterized protein n=1 Tax=Araneus ventricosus TaxID=182803 RepID=A0A4Y2WJF9_ARAVE|nr:hypothetical protein AVEN_131394-1 [Araneus ventricosus]
MRIQPQPNLVRTWTMSIPNIYRHWKPSSHPNYRRTAMNLCLPTKKDKLYQQQSTSNRRKRAVDNKHEPRPNVKHLKWAHSIKGSRVCFIRTGLTR